MDGPPSVPNRRARLLLLVTELQMGGAARVVRELASALASRFDVREAVFNNEDGVDFQGSVPISLDVGGGGGLLTKLRNLVLRVNRTRALKQSLSIDLSISHLEGAHWVDILSRGREKNVLCVHGSILGNGDIRGLSGWLRRRIIAPFVYNRADRVVTVSRDIVPELVSMGVQPERIRTINNFFEVEGIEKRSREPLSRAQAALFGDAPVLITAGRLAEQKNQQPLIEILSELRKRRPVRLLILGDGPLREQLLEQAEMSGLHTWSAWSGEPLAGGRDLYFLGVEANPFRWLSRANLFLLPSGWEGFPLALCEAMICGAPVMATDCPTGPREILAPETGPPAQALRKAEFTPFGALMPLLNRPDLAEANKAEWIETINRLLDRPVQLAGLAEAGRGRMDDFSRERIIGQWVELIEELLPEAEDATSR